MPFGHFKNLSRSGKARGLGAPTFFYPQSSTTTYHRVGAPTPMDSGRAPPAALSLLVEG